MKIRDKEVSLAATDLANYFSCPHLTGLDLRLAKGERPFDHKFRCRIVEPQVDPRLALCGFDSTRPPGSSDGRLWARDGKRPGRHKGQL
jgi:hypothetical protein